MAASLTAPTRILVVEAVAVTVVLSRDRLLERVWIYAGHRFVDVA